MVFEEESDQGLLVCRASVKSKTNVIIVMKNSKQENKETASELWARQSIHFISLQVECWTHFYCLGVKCNSVTIQRGNKE